MSENVQLPALGESVTEGTVTRWLKQVGETVEIDEPLLEVSTDKVDTEIPSPFSGVVQQILVQEDETVEVGAVLAVIGDGAATPEPAAPESTPAPAQSTPEPAAPESTPAAQSKTQSPPTTEATPANGNGEEVKLPALGESVTEGTVTRWLKQVGETVEIDEPLLEVSTDKVDTEIPSPFSGVVQQILVQEDETVEVGAVLAVIGDGAAAPATTPATPTPEATPEPEPAPAAPVAATPLSPTPPQSTPVAETTPAVSGGYLTPLVRKLANEKGIDPATVTGTGVGGRIRKEDILAAAEKLATEKAAATSQATEAPASPTPAVTAKAAAVTVSPLRGTTEKASRLRKIIAERMVEALQTQAQLTTVVEVDVTRVAKLRAKAKDSFKAREGANLTFLPFFTLAAVEALKAHPKINGVLANDVITYHGQENVGIAVDTERGLLVPVIRDAGDLNLAGLARKIADLAARTRANKVGPDELSGATFTITNTGSGGALIDTPIVPSGTSAILGTGTIVKRPAVIKGADGEEVIAIRSICYLSLSYDHRLVDGADASRYLMSVKSRIEEGAFEADLGI